MFTRQAPPLVNALWLGGLSAASASAAQNLLGQCRQALRHNGPVQFDYSRPDMRQITPASATQSYPGSQLPEPEDFPAEQDREDGLPESGIRPRGFLPADHMPNEPPAPDGPGEQPGMLLMPGMPTKDYFSGKYLYLDKNRREIGLEANDARRHAVFPRNLNLQNTVNSVTFTTETRDNNGNVIPAQTRFIELTISEKARETLFLLNVRHLTQTTYLKAVDLSDPTKIVFTTEQAWVFDPQPAVLTYEIPLVDCNDYGPAS